MRICLSEAAPDLQALEGRKACTGAKGLHSSAQLSAAEPASASKSSRLIRAFNPPESVMLHHRH